MINSVRNTVMSILNKNNYGYLSPSDFNLFAKQAQMDIFTDYFHQLNYQINKENARLVATGLTDISKQYKESIERFIVPPVALTYVSDNIFTAPSQITTGSDYFNILNIYCYDTTVTPKRFLGEADKAAPNEIMLLENSLMQSASTVFPLYVLKDDSIHIYPLSLGVAGAVECQYIRYPKDPKWTYVTITNGSPVFDQSQLDYQDFELPLDDEVELVIKICQYAGVMIREPEVYQFAKTEEVSADQSNK
jgi:hypothetical protein